MPFRFSSKSSFQIDPSQIVSSLYRALLDRDPRSQEVQDGVESLRRNETEGKLREILRSVEFQRNERASPLWNHRHLLWGYAAIFDPTQTVLAHENRERKAVPGHRVNYLGVAVNVNRFVPQLNLENIVEGPPIPGNWHTDLAEMSAVLRAVEYAGDSFSMLELGCGWGCWMSISGTVGRRLGKAIHVAGIEGDEGHLDFAREAMATNGIAPSQYELFHGIAAPRAGIGFFPIQDRPGVHWGLEPIFTNDLNEIDQIRGAGAHSELELIPLERVIADSSRLDLLHIDIQGGETALIRDSLDVLNHKVGYMVVGTHSRVIDGAIIDMLTGEGGWQLEIERPCIYSIEGSALSTRIDGVQGWRNVRMHP
jgi:hypothetical protein